MPEFRLDANGDDLSPTGPWRSIDGANVWLAKVPAGSRLVATGGQTFPVNQNPLTVPAGITVTSGGGNAPRAIMDAGKRSGIATVGDGVAVMGLEIRGSGSASNGGHGLYWSRPAGNAPPTALVFKDLVISGFGGKGLWFDTVDGSGLLLPTCRGALTVADVEIGDCVDGMRARGFVGGSVCRLYCHDLPGNADPSIDTANGLVFEKCSGILAEDCEFNDLGTPQTALMGSGFIGFDSDSLIFRRMTVRRLGGNPAKLDGGGGTLDFCNRCVIEDSVFVDGAGQDLVVLYMDGGPHATGDNVIRNNWCLRGQQRYAGQGAIYFLEAAGPPDLFEGNTVHMTPETMAGAAALNAQFVQGGKSLFRNNTFIVDSAGGLVAKVSGSLAHRFGANTYTTPQGFRAQTDAGTLASLLAWRAAVGVSVP